VVVVVLLELGLEMEGWLVSWYRDGIEIESPLVCKARILLSFFLATGKDTVGQIGDAEF
jgi:hypothetical protein